VPKSEARNQKSDPSSLRFDATRGNPKLEIRGRKKISGGRSAGFQTCRIADFQIGRMW
jgi:hypothetical protein